MPTAEEIDTFLAKRKGSLARLIRKEPKRAKEVLEKYGAPSGGEAMLQGLEQGALHGFADDIERSGRKDKTAVNHIRAQAAHPGGYLLAQLLGLGATGGVLRGAGGAAGKVRAGKVRSGNSSIAGGGQRRAAIEAKARKIEKDWSAFPLPGVKPRDRAIALDAGHGAALGYGGGDVSEDEKAVSAERALRAATGGILGLVGGPATTSTAAAAGNIPLLFGRRRAFSEKMLEPPGVSRASPAGRPREAIDIARTLDEQAARGGGEVSMMARDTTPPMQSTRPNVQQLADQALEPVAAQRIDQLARQERGAASDAIAAAYPDRRAPAPRRPAHGELEGPAPVAELGPSMSSLLDEAGLTNRQRQVIEMRQAGKTDAEISAAMGLGHYPGRRRMYDQLEKKGRERIERARAKEADFWNFANRITQQDAAKAGADSSKQLQSVVDRFNANRAVAPSQQRPIIPDQTINALLEPVVRRDRHAFESWSKTLENMNRRDPTVMPRMQGAVAQMLARTEQRSGGGHLNNNDPTLGLYLRTLRMSGNRREGIPNVIEAARGPAAARYDSRRFREARDRTAGGPRMRSRHAEALRREMETYQPPQYTGPAVGTMREPLQLRGDDQPAFLSPLDFYMRPDKVNNAQVTAAGSLSGPFAMMLGDALEPGLPRAPANVEQPIEAEFEEIPPQAAGLMRQLAPPPAHSNPVLAQAQRQPAAPQGGALDLQQAQHILTQRAGLPLERFGVDGVMGPETQSALRAFQAAAGIPATGALDEFTQRRLQQYRDGQLPDVMRAEIDRALAQLAGQ